MGIAYSDVSTGGVRLAAYVALTRRTKVLVNFGKVKMKLNENE